VERRGGVDVQLALAEAVEAVGELPQWCAPRPAGAGEWREYARAVARRYATRHEEVVLEPDAAATLPRLVDAFDEPLGDEAALPLYLICEAAREHVTVALSGQGADELMGGYWRYVGIALADAAGRASGADAERLNRIFDRADIVLTPMFTRRPPRVREFERRGGLTTLIGMVRLAPYAAPFNHTGQPAASVPAGFTADGFPLSAQLVGPPDSEALLVSVAAQLEKHTGWPAHTPRAAA
jgi:Asp-tRNA(Asn)/Glu-tRNA(Gln) amidotransferase A subunit family amidase